MKPAVVRLVDIGFHANFSATMAFAQSVVLALTAGGDGTEPAADVEFIRTREMETVQVTLVHPAEILHITAHGDRDPETLGFVSEDGATRLELADFISNCAEWQEGIKAGTLFADCCDTAQVRFTRGIRDCLAQPICYIGSRRGTNWYESTTFASAFYSARFRTKGRGLSPAARGLRAGAAAVEAYEKIAGPCPFKVIELEPSRKAFGLK